MSITVKEGDIELCFAAPWRVVKYDDDAEYLGGIGKLSGIWKVDENGEEHTRGVKGIDVLATRDSRLSFLEIKDFRKARISPEPRICNHLPLEVAFKVCDTIAGVIGICRGQGNTLRSEYCLFRDALADPKKDVEVLLWLEEKPVADGEERKRRKGRLSTLTKKLKQSCIWLTEEVLVINSAEYAKAMPDVVVKV